MIMPQPVVQELWQASRPAQRRESLAACYLPADAAPAWREILCVQDDRQVGNDNTGKWKRLSVQIPPSPLRPHFVRSKVRAHEYPDGRLAVFWGPHRLADYDPHGTIIHARALAA